jgi:filamentous hemagglutinin family protein
MTMSNAAHTSQSAVSKTARRVARQSLKPLIVQLSRTLRVTYWPQRRRSISMMLVAMLSPFVPSFVQAAPTGAEVVAGVAKVTKASATSTLINQATQKAIINWQSFSIGSGELVRFVQPNASSVALNRVIGSDPSRIFGSLQANGHVFLVNNAGVYFAPGAKVDVGGLVASSMDISNANFSSGNYVFNAGSHAGSVINDGQLRGGYVVLSAPQVGNAGSIATPGGSTALLAGGRMRMDLAGDKMVSLSVDGATANAAVQNSGNISADGGKVFMTARSANAVLDTVINTSGVVRANSLQSRNGEIVIDGGSAGVTAVSGTLAATGHAAGATGGSVKVLGDKVALNSGALIDVSGHSGGGQALVGGNFHGAGLERNASMTYVDQNARIRADALAKGDGGKVAVWADQHTTYGGSISAKGGANGGHGGFVETSGKQTLAFKGAVDTSAAKGKTGTLLLDPNDITISAAAGNLADNGAGTFISGTNSTSTVAVADIIAALATNNVTIDTTSAGGTGNGNITVASALSYNRANSLTLAAEGAISVNAGITNAGAGALNLHGNGNIGINAPISLAGGALHVAGMAGGVSRANTILNANSIATGGGNVTMQSTSVIQSGAINSGAGTINLLANNDVTISGALSTTNTGTGAIVVNAGASQAAGTAAGGNVMISGGSISTGAGGRTTLYSGDVATSTGLTALIGSNSGRFRYNSDESVSNYTVALGTGIYAIYREAPVLTLTGNQSIVYGSSDPTLAVASGLVNGDTLAQALSTQATLGLTAATTSGAGLRVAGNSATTVSGAVGQLGYAVNQVAGLLTVTPKSLSMSGLTVGAKVYDATTSATVLGAGALAAAENPGTGTSVDGIRYTGDALSIAGAATGTFNSAHVATATSVTFANQTLAGADAANYTLVIQAPAAATITPATLTSTLTNAGVTKTYDGTLAAPAGFTPTYNVTGFVAGDTAATLTNTGAAYDNAHVVGATQVTVSGLAVGGITGSNASAASDYVLDAPTKNVAAAITARTLTSTLTNTGVTKVYDGTTAGPAGFTPTYSFTNFASGDTAATLSNTGTVYDNAHVVGATQVTVGGLALTGVTGSNASVASDYVLDAASKTAAASITPATLTPTLSNAGVTKVYDGTTAAPAGFTPTYNITGFVAGDTAATLTNTGSAYNNAHVVGATQVTVSGLAVGSITGGNASVASDYMLDASSKNVAANITAALLTSTLTNAGVTKVYDGTTAAPAGFAPTYSFAGLVAGDTAATLTNTTALYDNAHVVGATQVTVGGLAISGVTGSNASAATDYVLDAASKNVAASITARTITSTLTNTGVTKVYDGTTAAPAGFTPTYSFANLAAGDTNATLSNTGTLYDNAHVVGATQVTVGGLALTGITGGNASAVTDYALDATSKSVAATVTPATLTPTLTNAGVTKSYDGTTAAPAGFTPTYSYAGFVAGDTAATLTNTGAAYNNAHVVGATQVTVSGLAVGSITGSNASAATDYVLDASSKNVAASITAALLTSTLSNTGVTKIYDGATTAPAGFTPTYTFTGLAAGDTTATLTNSGAVYDNAHVVGATQVTVSGLAIGGVTGSNASVASDYVLDAASKNVAATISARTITPTVTNAGVTKVYDGTTAAPAGFVPTYSFANLAAGDTNATLSNTGSVYNNAHVVGATQLTVGGLAITGITGGNASATTDYALDAASKNVAATITPATLTSTLTNAGVTKTYDGTTAAPAGFTPTYSFAGLVAGDTAATLTNTGAAYNNAHVVGATQVTVSGLAVGTVTGSNASVASDYVLDATSKNVAASITAATLTSTLSNTGVTKAYDGTLAAPAGFTPTYTFTGLVAGDTAATLTNTGALYNNFHVVGANQVTVSGLAIAGVTGSNASVASDYALDATSKSVAAAITPLTLTSTLTNAGVTKTYDGTVAAPAGFAPTFSLTGFLAGDTAAAITNTGAAYNSAHVASANQVTVSGLAIGSVTGSNASAATDYVLDAASKTVAAAVTARTITPTVSNTNVTKAYNATTAAPLCFGPTDTFANLAAGDTAATLSNTGSAYNSAHVATATQVTVGGLAITGITGANASVVSDYALDATSKSVAATITPLTLTSTLTNTGVTKVYDGTTAAPVGFAPTYTVTGFLAGDTAATLTNTSALYDSAHVLAATKVTVGGMGVGSITGANGSLGTDYVLDASSKSAAASITPQLLTPTLINTGVVKYYDTTTTAPVGFVPRYSFVGLVAGDTDAALANTSIAYNSPTPAGASFITVGGLSISGVTGSRASVPSDYLLDATSKTVAASIVNAPPNGGGLVYWSDRPDFSGFDCYLGAPGKQASTVCAGRAQRVDGVMITTKPAEASTEVLALPNGAPR